MLTNNKIIDIRLEEEKFYFPGEIIKGFVIVQPKNAIKVNSIQLKFFGQVYINLKEKEINTLFQTSTILSVNANIDTPKQTTLEAVENTFPFTFTVPQNLNLPSSMEFGKKAHIRYTIHALLDRPMMIESLCPKVDYTVSLLERIDIQKNEFKMPQEKYSQVRLLDTNCLLKASIPRLGFARGDIVPLKVTMDHFTSYTRKNGVTIDLIRTVEIRTTKHTVFKESVLKTTQHDTQPFIHAKLLIPTSTPPSIRYKDKVIRFHYKVRISFDLGEVHTLDLPIVIGTWPRANIPIDDDDDDDDDDDYSSLSSSTTLHNNNNNNNNRNSMILNKTDLNRNSTTVSSPDRLPSYHNNLISHQQQQHRTISMHTEYPFRNGYHYHHHRRSLPPVMNQRLSIYSTNEDIPTHILEPVTPSFTNIPVQPVQQESAILSLADSDSSFDSEEEEEEDDLLAIIERKKKEKKKELIKNL